MSAYRIMETIDLDGWAKNVVEAHAPKKKPPETFELLKLVCQRWSQDVMCRECQKPVDHVQAAHHPSLDEYVIEVRCHGERRQRAVRRMAFRAAGHAGKGLVVDLLHRVVCDPWFWPMPPPGPEVP